MTRNVEHELAPLLPDAGQTAVLLAALGDGDVAAEAWQRWWRGAGSAAPSATGALAPYKELLPLLAWSLERHAIAVDRTIATYLQFARLTEKLRTPRYLEVCGEVFGLLDAQRTAALVLKGAALGSRVYPSPTLRHCGDLDLLLTGGEAAAAWQALVAHGWTPEPRSWPMGRHLPRIFHPSGMPVELHRQLLLDYYRLDFDDLWARRQTMALAGHAVAVLSDTDALVHACAHGLGSGLNLRWVPDAFFLITRGDVHWQALVQRTIAARLSVPVSAALSYLESALGTLVPRDALAALADASRRADRRERAAARVGLKPVEPVSVRAIWATERGWRRRARLTCRLVFPPAAAVTAEYGLPHWQLPAYYAVRLYGYASRAGRHVIGRAIG